MIRFEQTGDSPLKDILVITDDAEKLDSMYDASLTASGCDRFRRRLFRNADLKAWRNLDAATKNEEGEYTFIIPADEASDVGDIFAERETGIPLSEFLDECNVKTIKSVEEHAE